MYNNTKYTQDLFYVLIELGFDEENIEYFLYDLTRNQAYDVLRVINLIKTHPDSIFIYNILKKSIDMNRRNNLVVAEDIA